MRPALRTLPVTLTITLSVLLVLLLGLSTAASAAKGLALATKKPKSSEATEINPQGMTSQQIADVLATMPDAQVRKVLLQQLEAQAAKPGATDESLNNQLLDLQSDMQLFQQRLEALIAQSPELPEDISESVETLTGGRGVAGAVWPIFVALCVLAAGFLVETLARRRLAGSLSQISDPPAASFTNRVMRSLLLLLFNLLFLVLFVLAALAVGIALTDRGTPSAHTAVVALIAVVLTRLAGAITATILSPRAPNIRIAAIGDAAAARAQSAVLWIAGSTFALYAVLGLLRKMGLDPESFQLLYMAGGLLVSFVAIAVIWRNRKPVGRAVASIFPEPSPLSLWLANSWHILATAYVLICIGLWEVSFVLNGRELGGKFLLSLLALPLFIVLNMALWRIVSHVFAAPPEEPDEPVVPAEAAEVIDVEAAEAGASETVEVIEQEPEAPPPPHGPKTVAVTPRALTIYRALRIVLALAFVVWLLDLWGLSLDLGERIMGSAMSILLTLIAGYFCWQYIKTAIDKKMAEQEPDLGGHEDLELGAGGSRKGTILTIVKKFALVFITVLVGLVILSSLGVNIGPLLAGAGIVGLAIGFGAQTLVQDVISGFFFLLDDAFRLGDFVETGSLMGTVEHISIRSLRLRHHRGAVHTVPYGGMKQITNYTRDWAVMKLDLRVPFNTDLDKVRKIIKKVGQRIADDPELGPKLLAPVKSQGVKEFDDSAMVLRVKFTTVPGGQFLVRREVYSQIQKLFAKHGIEFAPRRVIVQVPHDDALDEERRRAAAAAAAQQVVGGGKSGGSKGGMDDM